MGLDEGGNRIWFEAHGSADPDTAEVAPEGELVDVARRDREPLGDLLGRHQRVEIVHEIAPEM